MDLIKREKEILRRENELLKMIAEAENKAKVGEKITKCEKLYNKDVEKTNTSAEEKLTQKVSDEKFKISFSVLKEMIPEYDGGTFPELWISQFQNLDNAYDLDEKMKKTLLMCKLKGKAQMWLHSKPNFINDSTHNILEEMKRIFSTKENKLMMRRNFEARKWKYNEPFVDYYNDKIMLSNNIGIDDDELIDPIIDGIPDNQL